MFARGFGRGVWCPAGLSVTFEEDEQEHHQSPEDRLCHGEVPTYIHNTVLSRVGSYSSSLFPMKVFFMENLMENIFQRNFRKKKSSPF